MAGPRRRSRAQRRPPAATPWSAEELVELAVRHNLAELEVETDGARIRVVREHRPAAPAAPHGGPGPADRALALPATDEPTRSSPLVVIEAPMVGTFYRASSPTAPPFVSEGDVIKEGQVLCIIEAMKLMNEIEAKLAGRVVKILVENAQPVEYGQPLFQIDPLR